MVRLYGLETFVAVIFPRGNDLFDRVLIYYTFADNLMEKVSTLVRMVKFTAKMRSMFKSVM